MIMARGSMLWIDFSGRSATAAAVQITNENKGDNIRRVLRMTELGQMQQHLPDGYLGGAIEKEAFTARTGGGLGKTPGGRSSGALY